MDYRRVCLTLWMTRRSGERKSATDAPAWASRGDSVAAARLHSTTTEEDLQAQGAVACMTKFLCEILRQGRLFLTF